jgi:hypothetical protein
VAISGQWDSIADMYTTSFDDYKYSGTLVVLQRVPAAVNGEYGLLETLIMDVQRYCGLLVCVV